MLQSVSYQVKALSTDSIYYKEYINSICKDDLAIQIFGKSDADDTDMCWDSIHKECVPWRGGTIKTNRGIFCWCAYITWWTNRLQDKDKLYNRLLSAESINEGDKRTIYFWKSEK